MNYKSLTTIVPDWANWSTVDESGAIWVWRNSPLPRTPSNIWDFDHRIFEDIRLISGLEIGMGPKPKDWRKEIYRLVADE